MKKGKILIKFGAVYSEEEKDGIVSALGGQFEVGTIPDYASMPGVSFGLPPLSIVVTLAVGISLVSFLKSFAGEAGKLLAQRLFPRSKRYGRKINLQICCLNKKGQKVSFAVSGVNPQELLEGINQRLRERL